jgi:hypothetical protein
MNKYLLILLFCIFAFLVCKSPYTNFYSIKQIKETFTSASNCLSHLKSDYKKKECTETKTDENNCRRIKLDEKIIELNGKFSALRCMEYAHPKNTKVPRTTTEEEKAEGRTMNNGQKIANMKKLANRYKKAQPILLELYQIMYEHDDINGLSYYQEFMRELYQRYIYYYPIINNAMYLNVYEETKITGNNYYIPIYSYVKNNNCIIPLLRDKVKADLIHFDTHSDHKEFDKFNEYDELITTAKETGEDIDIERLQQIAYDIACFSSYYIHYSKTNFFWITPQWVTEHPDYEKVIQKIIKNPTSNKAQYIPANPIEKDAYISVIGKLLNSRKNTNNGLPINDMDEDTSNKEKYKHFKLLSSNMDNDFILSLDLDYFCTNGLLPSDMLPNHSHATKREILSNADQASFGRTRIQTEFTNPYYYYVNENFTTQEQQKQEQQKQEQQIDSKIYEEINPEVIEKTYNGVVKNSQSYVSYINNLKNELELIKERINVFKQFLNFIKKTKKINPIMILISDSTAVHLSTDNESVSLTNDFCPQNLIMYVRQLTIEALQEVYSTDKEQDENEYMQFPEI